MTTFKTDKERLNLAIEALNHIEECAILSLAYISLDKHFESLKNFANIAAEALKEIGND